MSSRTILAVVVLACIATAGAAAQDAGTMIFATSPIDPADPGGTTDRFAAGDHLYAVAYFDQDLVGLTGRSTNTKALVEVFLYELTPPLYDYQDPSEVQLEFASLTVTGAPLGQQQLVVDLVPDSRAMTAYGTPDLTYKKYGPNFDGPVKFAQRLSQLEAGEHEIVVKVKCNYSVVAEGRFVLAGDDFSSYAIMAEDINAAAAGLKTKDTMMPRAAMSDPALEQEMVAAFTASQTYRDRVKGDVVRLVIIDPEWMIRRHELTGAILHRYVRAAIAVKNADGTCTLWNLVTFQQDYVSDAFQATRFDGVGDPVPIPCENVHQGI